MQKVAAGRAADGGASLSMQRARLATAQARISENKANLQEGKFVEIEQAANLFGETCGVIREILLALPGKASDSLSPFTPNDRAAIHKILHREVCATLVELRNPEHFVRPAGTSTDTATDEQ
jgi:phage terminase Nu1 subunit (DNA packaging protein)